MTLVDRIFWEDEPTASNQVLAAIMRLWFVGHTTRAQTITDLEILFVATLTPAEKATLDEFKANYDGKTTAQKGQYMDTVHSTMVLAEYGKGAFLTKPKFKEINEIT